MTTIPPQDQPLKLNWKTTPPIDHLPSLNFINWPPLAIYASTTRHKLDGISSPSHLSPEYTMGGLHVVRRINFADGTQWLARVQRKKPTAELREKMRGEVATMQVVRARSQIPVPRVYAWDDNGTVSKVGAGVMLMEFVLGNTAMDSFGGWDIHRGELPDGAKQRFLGQMAGVQVEMAGVRFARIGSVVRRDDERFDVGPIPGIGGPFDTAGEFFEAWADSGLAKYPYKEEMIRERTPANLVEEVLEAIRGFPKGLGDLARWFPFREGPFPLIHTDLYCSNVIIDGEGKILSVIDWEGAMVGPWELVEFNKELLVVPSVMDGPVYKETEARTALLLAQKEYVEVVHREEKKRGFDTRLSEVLADEEVQALALAFWLYGDGRIGCYDRVLAQLDHRQKKS